FGVACGKRSPKYIEQPTVPSPTRAPLQKTHDEEEKEDLQHFAIHKSDSQILELTQNGLKSLPRKLELVVPGKTENDSFLYWEFPLWFSQSRLEGRIKISNACTLITMSIAGAFYGNRNLSDCLQLNANGREGMTEMEKVAMVWHKVCPPELIRVMKEGIITGNKIYDEERKRGTHSVMYAGKDKPLKDIIIMPDAIQARNRFVVGGSGSMRDSSEYSVMNEVDFVRVKGEIGKRLPKVVKFTIRHPALSDWNIFCFTIICFEKAVSLVYRRDSDLFCVLDSHAHDGNKTGAIIAISSRENFHRLSAWMQQRIFVDSSRKQKKKFELSLLQWSSRSAVSPLNPNSPILSKIYPQPKNPAGLHSTPITRLNNSSSSDSGYGSDEIPSY
ncbi:hypothetical protein PFISCL1PPCAC_2452, partial [Pristionchus fissidentatus]